MQPDIRSRIRKVESLPSPPVLAAELVELTSREDVRIAQIAALIERDPALTTKLLKLCNSAAFGIRHKVSSIERATVMLGIRQIKSLALGFMILSESEMQRADYFDFSHYWKRASVTAVGARTLANHAVRNLAGEAFVCGLVQDIGVLLLQHVAADAYRIVVQSAPSSSKRLYELEESVLNISHMEAGEILLREWGLPDTVYLPVRYHHVPQTFEGENDSTRRLVEVAATAAEICNLFCEPGKGESMERVMRVCGGYFHLREDEAHEMLGQVGDDARETAWMFEINADEPFDYTAIREAAGRELATLSADPRR